MSEQWCPKRQLSQGSDSVNMFPQQQDILDDRNNYWTRCVVWIVSDIQNVVKGNYAIVSS
jgi:hypothetical protein